VHTGVRKPDGGRVDKKRPDLAPLCVKSVAFPPVDGAPVLAAVEKTALDCGCGSALSQGVGNGAKKGWASDSCGRSLQVGGSGKWLVRSAGVGV